MGKSGRHSPRSQPHNRHRKHQKHKYRRRSSSRSRSRSFQKNQKKHGYNKNKQIQKNVKPNTILHEGWQIQQLKQQKQVKTIVKQMPCWTPSNILLQYYNARQGVNLKFHEPPESRAPVDVWKIYVFKGEQVFQPIQLKNSCYLIGKDDRICDILCQHPSISRQHAVIQFRLISKPNNDGTYSEYIKPYIMDLQSTNGTFVEGQKIQPSRYVQLLHKDVVKFGFSERQYVLVHDETAAIQRGENEQQDG